MKPFRISTIPLLEFVDSALRKSIWSSSNVKHKPEIYVHNVRPAIRIMVLVTCKYLVAIAHFDLSNEMGDSLAQ